MTDNLKTYVEKEYVAPAALMETKLGVVVIAEVGGEFESSSLKSIRALLHTLMEDSKVIEPYYRDLLILEAYLAVLDQPSEPQEIYRGEYG